MKVSLWTAIVTPLTKEGFVDFDSFDVLLRRQEQAKNGIVILGSTGEGLALSETEKQQIVQYTVEQELNVPVMVGVAGFNLEQTLDWLKFCESLDGIDSYLMPMPLYAKPGVEGQVAWFTSLLNAVDRPCMLYNVPSRTGAKLSFETVQRLHGHKNFWALKEASGSLDDFKTFGMMAPDVELYSGEDGLMASLAYYQAKGLVSVMSNVWPEETNLFVQKCLNFELDSLYPTWDVAAESMFIASNPVPAKAILAEKGLIRTNRLRAPLSHKDLKSIELIQKADQLVSKWYGDQSNNEDMLHDN